jgi:hypothetical protein
MKKIILFLISAILIAMPCFAEEIIQPEKPMFQAEGLNVQGDTLFFMDGTMALGVGVKLGTFKDGAYELRAEIAGSKTGIGVSLNIPEMVKKVGGTWEALNFNPSLGLVGMVDLKDIRESQLAINANLIEVKF